MLDPDCWGHGGCDRRVPVHGHAASEYEFLPSAFELRPYGDEFEAALRCLLPDQRQHHEHPLFCRLRRQHHDQQLAVQHRAAGSDASSPGCNRVSATTAFGDTATACAAISLHGHDRGGIIGYRGCFSGAVLGRCRSCGRRRAAQRRWWARTRRRISISARTSKGGSTWHRTS